MGGKAPRLIITDEDASMKSAIRSVFPDTIHRLCMWHILEKVPEKVGPPTNDDPDFWSMLNNCVWDSEREEEFELKWNATISHFGLEGNDWLANRYRIRESWIPLFFMDIPLAGVLRTTSRSERSNSFFNRFIHQKLSFVEFWLRFDTALECQRHEELKADHISIHGIPELSTPWPIEKQASVVYTYKVFRKFQEQVKAARDRCSVVGITQQEGLKFVTINGGNIRDRVVQWSTSDLYGSCSCKLFESFGIPCRHIILTLRAEKIYDLPSSYILKRWEKRCKRESVYDEEGNLLDEKPIDDDEVEKRKKISAVRNKVEDLLQSAKNSKEGLDFLVSSVMNIEAPLGHIVPTAVKSSKEEYEGFIGCKIPEEVQIHPPTYVHSKGRSKRIKRAKELPKPRKGKKAKEPPTQ